MREQRSVSSETLSFVFVGGARVETDVGGLFFFLATGVDLRSVRQLSEGSMLVSICSIVHDTVSPPAAVTGDRAPHRVRWTSAAQRSDRENRQQPEPHGPARFLLVHCITFHSPEGTESSITGL